MLEVTPAIPKSFNDAAVKSYKMFAAAAAISMRQRLSVVAR